MHVPGAFQQRQVGQVGDDRADSARHVNEAVQETADLDEAADDGQHDASDIDTDDQLGEGIGLVCDVAIIHLVSQVADAADAEPEDHDIADLADELGEQADNFLVGEDAGDDGGDDANDDGDHGAPEAALILGGIADADDVQYVADDHQHGRGYDEQAAGDGEALSNSLAANIRNSHAKDGKDGADAGADDGEDGDELSLVDLADAFVCVRVPHSVVTPFVFENPEIILTHGALINVSLISHHRLKRRHFPLSFCKCSFSPQIFVRLLIQSVRATRSP